MGTRLYKFNFTPDEEAHIQERIDQAKLLAEAIGWQKACDHYAKVHAALVAERDRQNGKG